MAKKTATLASSAAPRGLPPEPSMSKDKEDMLALINNLEWEETPEYDPPGVPKSGKLSKQRIKYQERYKRNEKTSDNGTKMWRTYVAFGFYAFDDPTRFATIWNSFTENENKLEGRLHKARWIWNQYCYYNRHDKEMHKLLANSGHKVKSFLEEEGEYAFINKCIRMRSGGMKEIPERDEEVEYPDEKEAVIDVDEEPMNDDEFPTSNGEKEEREKQKPRRKTKEDVEMNEAHDDEDDEDDEDYEDEEEEEEDEAVEEDEEAEEDEEDETMQQKVKKQEEKKEDVEASKQATSEKQTDEKMEDSDPFPPLVDPPKPKRLTTAATMGPEPPKERKKSAPTQITPDKADKDSERQLPGNDDDATISSEAPKDTKVNDGTFRFQMQWSPSGFNDIKETGALWNKAFVPVVKQLLENPKAFLHAWDSSDRTMAHASLVNEFNLRKFLSPSITPYSKNNTFFFALRVSFSNEAPPQIWLAKDDTKKLMKDLRIRIAVSNASSDGGQLTNAGVLLFKDPKMCHRHRYLQSLRMDLPPSTPNFDIVPNRRTENGKSNLHLSIQCGEKHVGVLTEILQNHLNGKNRTACFLGRQSFQQMGSDALNEIFEKHKEFVTGLVKIPIPFMSHLDNPRHEHGKGDEEIIARSMRQWADSLQDENGNQMQADVENGGRDKNAYLLVPARNADAGKQAVQEYRERVRPFKQRQARFQASIAPRDQPNAIYIPTQAAIANIEFLRAFTNSAAHWKKAPNSVKVAPGTKISQDTTTDTEARSEIRDDITEMTTATSQSGLSGTTTKLSEFDKQYAEIEKRMQEQAEEMQAASSLSSNRFKNLEEKLLSAMSHNQKTNERVTAIDGKMDKMAVMLEQIVTRMDHLQQMPSHVANQSPVASLKADDDGKGEDDSSAFKSPVKKKKKTNNTPSDGQYKEQSSAAGWDKC